MPVAGILDGGDALQNCRIWCAAFDLFVSEDVKRIGKDVQKLPIPQEIVRVFWAAKSLISLGEGFIDQHAIVFQGVGEVLEQRPMKVIRNHNSSKTPPGKGPCLPHLKVSFDGFDPGVLAEFPQPVEVPVESDDRMPRFQKKFCMATAATGKVKNVAAFVNVTRKSDHPIGRGACIV